MTRPMTTVWALWTAMPIQALRYLLVAQAMRIPSRIEFVIAHGTCKW